MFSAAQILAMLQMLGPLFLTLEASGVAELNTLIAAIPNATEKQALQDLVSALDTFAKAELAKI